MSPTAELAPPDFDRCYRALSSRDARFDGWFIVGVTSTGIYCRPSCPAPVRPRREHVRLFPTAAAAQGAGFRACKRCRPDAAPGSPEWNMRGDVVGRAMRLIDDGLIDRQGVPGLAARLAVSPRHLQRLLVDEVGAGPLALARAKRAHTARILIETTDLSFADVAFAAGFGSIRQFNDTIREVYAATPGELRSGRRRAGPGALAGLPSAPPGPPGAASRADGATVLRLALRPPYDARWVFGFLARHAIPGVTRGDETVHERNLVLPHGRAWVRLTPAHDHVRAELHLEAMLDLAVAVARCRRLLDLDADPAAITEGLSADPRLAGPLAMRPGLRLVGSVDGFEAAVTAVIGQQISVAGARTMVARLVAAVGSNWDGRPVFPTAPEVAELDLGGLGLTTARQRCLHALATAVAGGSLVLDHGADRTETYLRLLAIPGIGPWTAKVVLLTALGDPDVLLSGDLAVRRAAASLGLGSTPADLTARSAGWQPWRSYVTHLLWAHHLVASGAGAPGGASASPVSARLAGARAAGVLGETCHIIPSPRDRAPSCLGGCAPTHKGVLPMSTPKPTCTLARASVASPFGALTVVASATGVRTILWPDESTPESEAATDDPDQPICAEAARQLGEYFAGERTSFDLPLDLCGTEFQVSAWQALGTIGYAETVSYGEQARRLGRPKSVRAVGAANGRNPIPIVLPCHRVVGADGSLTGYAAGLDAKRWLLDHEQQVAGHPLAR